MLDDVKRFDMGKKPMRQHLRPLIWALSLPDFLKHKCKITKVNMEGIKPPYLLLCNHNAFLDFKVSSMAIFPHRANYVVAIDGFLKREWLLRLVGCICKRKFTNDTTLIRQLREVIKRGDIAAIYPEARYSLCGTTAVLPAALGKLAKLLRVPVVTLICNGHHVNSPFWNLPDHNVKGTTATMTCLFTAEQLEKLTHQQVFEGIQKAFVYDDYKWQKENHIVIDYKNRAKGLNKVLYQCAACKTEYRMEADGTTLRCTHCGKEWQMTELGELKAVSGETEFSHIPDWYEWERANVKKEIEEGRYNFSCTARVDSLPNSKGYIDLGKASFAHNMQGFFLKGNYKGEEYSLEIPASILYSCHIEYDYLGKFGDCVDLNTLKDTLYIYPEGRDFSVTKISIATEELWHHLNGK